MVGDRIRVEVPLFGEFLILSLETLELGFELRNTGIQEENIRRGGRGRRRVDLGGRLGVVGYGIVTH
jgi:hypothetical protein